MAPAHQQSGGQADNKRTARARGWRMKDTDNAEPMVLWVSVGAIHASLVV